MTGHPAPQAQTSRAGSVMLPCGNCKVRCAVPESATQFTCRVCQAANVVFDCAQCGSVSIAASRSGAPMTSWTCDACGGSTQVPRFGRLPVRTAGDAVSVSQVQPVATARPETILTGFEVLSSNRPALLGPGTFTVTVTSDAVMVRNPSGTAGHRFPFEDLTTFAVSGRTSTRRAREGGLLSRGGQPGAGEESVLRLATATDSVVLRHSSRLRDQLAEVLSPAIARWRASQEEEPPAPSLDFSEAIEELERIAVLRSRGEILEAQYVVQRVALIRRISARGPDRRTKPHQY